MTKQLPPATELKLPHPDELTFGTVFAIKAATGVDVVEPESGGAQLLGLLWYALNDAGHKWTWAECLDVTGEQVSGFMDQLRATDQRRRAEAARAKQAADAAEDEIAIEEQRRALTGEPDPGPTRPAEDPTLPPVTGSPI